MIFAAPMPWLDILSRIAGLQAMPTEMGSAELSTVPKDIRADALFSARTNSAAYLAEVRAQLADYAAGKINMATVKMNLQAWLQKAGYTPAGGFPGEAPVPPAQSFLQNLASDKRITLVIDTIAGHALNTGMAQRFNSPNLLLNYPCWEFLRLEWRKHPRGEGYGKGESDTGWQERWVRCGGALVDGGRMIARRDSDIWSALGDSGTWSDGMDSDVPPFAFNSGFGWNAVDRQECIDLGVINEDDDVQARQVLFMSEFDPAHRTLADVRADRSGLIAALAELDKAA